MKWVPKYSITIRLADGSKQPVVVRDSYTISRVLREAGIPEASVPLQVYFKGREVSLEDCSQATLSSLGIGPGIGPDEVIELKHRGLLTRLIRG